MTEKRFTYDKPLVAFSKGGINDNVTGETYEFTIDSVLDLLNELHKENKKLKQVNEMLQMDFVMTERNLIEENEQLKQQIQQLQHWNNCLAEKRHQELSYKPYTPSKSEKELKELLEPKLFNCSDR